MAMFLWLSWRSAQEACSQHSNIHKRISAIAQPALAIVAEDDKRCQRAMNHLKGNPFQIAVSTVIAMILANSFTPVMSQYRGENEKKWAASIQSDIKNGASAENICNNASSSATTSDEISFKDWAYSVARKYCTSGFQEKEGESDPDLSIAIPEASQCRLSSSQVFDISQGKRTVVVGNNCVMSFY